MQIHTMSLHEYPFSRIMTGEKTIEYRLFDEKRKNIQLGDKIEFTNRDSGMTCMTQVLGVLHYPTFNKLFNDIHSHLRDESVGLYYIPEEEKKYGVVGIKIRKL